MSVFLRWCYWQSWFDPKTSHLNICIFFSFSELRYYTADLSQRVYSKSKSIVFFKCLLRVHVFFPNAHSLTFMFLDPWISQMHKSRLLSTSTPLGCIPIPRLRGWEKILLYLVPIGVIGITTLSGLVYARSMYLEKDVMPLLRSFLVIKYLNKWMQMRRIRFWHFENYLCKFMRIGDRIFDFSTGFLKTLYVLHKHKSMTLES